MGDISGSDFISDLPQSIIESILSQLPIRDAVRTSCLSSKWRYKWTTLTQLVFDEGCVHLCESRNLVEKRLIDFITRLLLLHEGPIHKFQISTPYLLSCPEVDQWILFLSRNDIKELILELGEGEWFRVPSCLFNCDKLTRLELSRCELDPPQKFKGFMCLKSLILHQFFVASEAIESLICSCPLLESLSLSYFDSLTLIIRAPNLKYLYIEGEIKDICLEDTPHLIKMYIAPYMTEDFTDPSDLSSCSNFVKLLGGVPNLEKLIGHIYFTKYLSIGNDAGEQLITYKSLKTIELDQVSFEDMKEILVVLRLITSSPNLEELQISGSSNTSAANDAPNLDFWEKECPQGYMFSKLKVVKMTEISGGPLEMEFIKFLLEHAPVLEKMSVVPCLYDAEIQLNMLVELVSFCRASANAKITFYRE